MAYIYMLNWAVTYTIVAIAGSMFISDGPLMEGWTDRHERKQLSAFWTEPTNNPGHLSHATLHKLHLEYTCLK